MNEFPVDPSKLEWLASRPGHRFVESVPNVTDMAEGAMRAERIISAWARTETERAFLEALSAGHEIAEARRLSGLTRSKADALLRLIRGERDESHKRV